MFPRLTTLFQEGSSAREREHMSQKTFDESDSPSECSYFLREALEKYELLQHRAVLKHALMVARESATGLVGSVCQCVLGSVKHIDPSCNTLRWSQMS